MDNSRYWSFNDLLNQRSLKRKEDLTQTAREWSLEDNRKAFGTASERRKERHDKINKAYRENVFGGLSEEQILEAVKDKFPEYFI